MPVTIQVAQHPAVPVSTYIPLANLGDPEAPSKILSSTWGRQYYRNQPQCFTSSVNASAGAGAAEGDAINGPPAPAIAPRKNGFIEGIVEAYSSHHHVTISPDDIWIAILTQFNFYVNAHAEELRAHFVAHDDKKELYVDGWPIGSAAATEAFTLSMVNAIKRNVVDDNLADWILPDFTTTTSRETVVCTVLMMSTLKAYFSYAGGICCGIPSITLEGEISDWESILARIDKLESFGEEPTSWAALLRPIIKRFIKAFEPGVEQDTNFWERICNHENGSGFMELSGWIAAFCVWDEKGRWRGDKIPKTTFERRSALVLDDVPYPSIHMSEFTIGYAEVDLKLNDDLQVVNTVLVAGHMGYEIYGAASDSLRPYPAWFLVEKPKQ